MPEGCVDDCPVGDRDGSPAVNSDGIEVDNKVG